jgi:hypothetical protein
MMAMTSTANTGRRDASVTAGDMHDNTHKIKLHAARHPAETPSSLMLLTPTSTMMILMRSTTV